MWGWVEYDDRQTRKRNSAKQYQKRRESYAPDPMPESRERNLEIPLENPVPVRESQSRLRHGRRTATFQQTKSQEQCLLLKKLPLDIRLLIWEECLGGELLHIVREPGRLGYIICPFWNLEIPIYSLMSLVTQQATRKALAEWASPGYTSNHICWSPQDSDGLSYARTHESKLFGLNSLGKRSFLPLLQTCRQIYTEALPMLYQTNVFDLKAPDALLHLPRTTIHVNLIRSLRLSWTFCVDPLQPRSDVNQQPVHRVLFTEAIPPFDLETWLQACGFLSTMKGLQDLVILIEGTGWVSESPESASQLLLPLIGVKVGRFFEVHVPWESNEWEDAVVSIVENPQKQGRLQTKRKDDAPKTTRFDNVGWAGKILRDSTERNAAEKGLTLDRWTRILKNKERICDFIQKDDGSKIDDDITVVMETDKRSEKHGADNVIKIEKGKAKGNGVTNEKTNTGTDEWQSEQKVGFTIVRREELLDITKLPTFPPRRKRRRTKAFGRR